MKNIRLLVIVVFLFTFSLTNAQYVFIPDQTGRPLTDTKYETLTGSPYLIEEWSNAEVKLADNKIVKPEAVRYDLVTDKLLFKQDNKVYEFSPRVAAFSLLTKTGTRTFLLKNDNDGYFEVLTNGKVKLMKKVKKVILEAKGYNSANIEKTVDEKKKYYVIYDGKEKEVKLSKKALVEALPEFKDNINGYKLSSAKEDAFVELITSLN